MYRSLIFFIIILFCSNKFNGYAQERPKLVVGIVVDQMRWDYLYKYQENYTENGFKRLTQNGFSCERTYIPYIPTYTAPGHATIFTGSIPVIHGIVANDWKDKVLDKNVYCTEDSQVDPVGSVSESGKMSPRNMLSTTIGDELKLTSNGRSKVFGVAMKDRGAILPAGHSANGAYWYDSESGNFITSSYYRNTLPKWVERFNHRNVGDSLMLLDWQLILSKELYKFSSEDENNYEGKFKWKNNVSFPYATSKAVELKDKKAILTSPHGNTITSMFAKELILNEKLGKGDEVDFLSISFSSTDYMGHFFGINALEIEDAYIRMDREIADLLQFLDKEIGEGEYLVFLTADHGAANNAQYLLDRKIPAKAKFLKEWINSLNEYLSTVFNEEKLVLSYMNYQIHFDENKIDEKNIDRKKLKEYTISYLNKLEGITISFDMEGEVESTAVSIFKERSQNAYFYKRSGTIQIILDPNWYSAFASTGTTHGSWNPYDAHIPLIFYGKNIPKGKSYKNYSMSDIAATIAAILQIQEPNGSVGVVIEELLIN